MSTRSAVVSGLEEPVRTCVGCGAKRPKRMLIRLVRDERGCVIWDETRHMPGRGAYLCPSGECLAAAIKRGRFHRSFRQTVDTDSIRRTPIPWMT